MDSHKSIWKDLMPIVAGQALCTAVMIGIFALLGYYDQTVLLGGLFGGLCCSFFRNRFFCFCSFNFFHYIICHFFKIFFCYFFYINDDFFFFQFCPAFSAKSVVCFTFCSTRFAFYSSF